MNLKEYQTLKALIEQKQRQETRLEGALEQHYLRMQDELGCKSVKEANKQIDKEEREVIKLRKEYEDKLKAFETRFGGVS